MDTLALMFNQVQQLLFEAAVEPLVFALGLGARLEEAYNATGWLLLGVLQLAVMVGVLVPLQRWRPVEPLTDRATVRTDILYTLIHRLGFFRLLLFFSITPWMEALFGSLRAAGMPTWHLDDLWPGVTDLAWVSLLLYLLLFDFLDYWIHRGQHYFKPWWALHALHHAQRQMTLWSDQRNHFLDDLLRDVLLVSAAFVFGVAPGQFVAIVFITQLSESLQHANLRLSFGPLGQRLWVSPHFHRRHHAIGTGHESVGPDGGQRLGGCNFGVLLPWWDMLFGTANFSAGYTPTGVRDQVTQGRDYGRGLWAQQWLGLLRLIGRA